MVYGFKMSKTATLDTFKCYFLCNEQVCVSECPTANEFGVRNNPVCVEGVDTSRFMNLDDPTAAPDIAVSSLYLSLTHTYTLVLTLSHYFAP